MEFHDMLHENFQFMGKIIGIRVTTSCYDKASFECAEGKPLELLGGSNLLFLLKEHVGVDARIVMPQNWKDRQFDSQD